MADQRSAQPDFIPGKEVSALLLEHSTMTLILHTVYTALLAGSTCVIENSLETLGPDKLFKVK